MIPVCLRCKKRGGKACSIDGVDIIAHRYVDCPEGLFGAGGFVPEGAMVRRAELLREFKAQQIQREGPKLWRELHEWALAFKTTSIIDAVIAHDWLSRFANRVPCGDCRLHWRAMVDRSPPPFTSAEDLFFWTVDRHDETNVMKGKPIMGRAAALALYPSSPETRA